MPINIIDSDLHVDHDTVPSALRLASRNAIIETKEDIAIFESYINLACAVPGVADTVANSTYHFLEYLGHDLLK